MKKAIIIGAGPAGLTAAFELLQRSAIRPIVFERTDYIGGISRTANYKGNRIDIGGHRFFSKSDRVMHWWLQFMPLEQGTAAAVPITYQQQTRTLGSSGSADSSRTDTVMLVRPRKSRIYFLRRFFDYPIRLSADTLRKLGAIRTIRIGISYLNAVARPIKPESNLEEFFINRFGVELYRTFFRDYTEKVWGVPCSRISAEWGAQRVKGTLDIEDRHPHSEEHIQTFVALPKSERNGNIPDRALPLSEIRSRPALGGGRSARTGRRRRNSPQLGSCPHAA